MKKLWMCLLLLYFCAANAQDVVYLKRSEVLPFMMGQQVGTLTGQVLDARQYTAQRQAAYLKLEALRQELAKCGNCAQRDRLAAQVKDLREANFREDGKLCGTFDALSDFNPAVGAMKKLMGYSEVCERYEREAAIGIENAKHARNRADFASRLKAGDMTAYASMGRRVMTTFSNLPLEQRLDMACPYWAEGSRKGDRLSTAFFGDECLGRPATANAGNNTNATSSDREGYERLKACAASDHLCAASLAVYYETTRRKDRTWPVEANDREALRLWESVVAHWEKRHALAPTDSNVAYSLKSAQNKASLVRDRLSNVAGASPLAPAR